MKKILLGIMAIFVVGQVYAGTLGGFVIGRVSKSCKKDATAAYAQGYRDAVADCKRGNSKCK